MVLGVGNLCLPNFVGGWVGTITIMLTNAAILDNCLPTEKQSYVARMTTNAGSGEWGPWCGLGSVNTPMQSVALAGYTPLFPRFWSNHPSDHDA